MSVIVFCVCVCFYGRVCVLDGGGCVCVCLCVYAASCGSERGVTAFAWFAAEHTLHSGTVIFVP